jgi:hypothetical protein
MLLPTRTLLLPISICEAVGFDITRPSSQHTHMHRYYYQTDVVYRFLKVTRHAHTELDRIRVEAQLLDDLFLHVQQLLRALRRCSPNDLFRLRGEN